MIIFGKYSRKNGFFFVGPNALHYKRLLHWLKFRVWLACDRWKEVVNKSTNDDFRIYLAIRLGKLVPDLSMTGALLYLYLTYRCACTCVLVVIHFMHIPARSNVGIKHDYYMLSS